MADDVRKLIEKLEREKAEIETTLKILRREVGLSPKSSPSTKEKHALTEIIPGEFHGLSQTEASYKLLKKIGSPLETKEILEMLKGSGFEFKGKNPVTILYRALHRMKGKFEKVKRNTWGLSEWYPSSKKEQSKKEKEAQLEGQSPSVSKGGEEKESD